jgi:hypothetical protein
MWPGNALREAQKTNPSNKHRSGVDWMGSILKCRKGRTTFHCDPCHFFSPAKSEPFACPNFSKRMGQQVQQIAQTITKVIHSRPSSLKLAIGLRVIPSMKKDEVAAESQMIIYIKFETKV